MRFMGSFLGVGVDIYSATLPIAAALGISAEVAGQLGIPAVGADGRSSNGVFAEARVSPAFPPLKARAGLGRPRRICRGLLEAIITARRFCRVRDPG